MSIVLRVSTPMVGRDRERAVFNDVQESVLARTAQVVVVRGEAGIGKSRLVEAVLDESSEWIRAVGHATPVVGGELPLAPIIELLAELAGSGLDLVELAAEFATPLQQLVLPRADAWPDGLATEGGLARSRMFTSARVLFERIAEIRPLLLVIEDLHWADPSTLDLVGILARSLRRVRVMILLTVRVGAPLPAPASMAIAELLRVPGVQILELGPLGPADIAGLLRSAAPGAKAADQGRLARDSGGNPFFALEAVGRGGDPLARHFSALVLAGHSDLSAPADAVLRTAAVLGEQIDAPLLAACVNLDDDTFEGAARQLVERHLLISDKGRYDFRHAIVREVVADDLTSTERLAIHRRIVVGMRQATGRVDVVSSAEWAHHLLAAREFDAGVAAAITAGDDAARIFAFAEARQQFAAATLAFDQLQPSQRPVGVTRAGLLLREGIAALRSGDSVGTVKLLVAAQADPELPATDRSLLGEALGDALWECGRTADAVRAYQEAVAEVAADHYASEAVQARIQSAYAKGLLRVGRLDDARAAADAAVRLAGHGGAENVEIDARITVAAVDVLRGRSDAGHAELNHCLSRALELNDIAAVLRSATNLSGFQLQQGRYTQGWATAEQSLASCRTFGAPLAMAGGLVNNSVWALFAADRWEECAREGGAALDELASPGDGVLLHLTLAELSVARGDESTANAHLVDAASVVTDDSFTIAMFGSVRAEQQLWADDPIEARRQIDSVFERLHAIGSQDIDEYLVFSLRALQLRAIADQIERDGASEPLLRQADQALAAVNQSTTELPPLRALTRLCEAEAARTRRSDTATVWEDVASAWSAMDRRYLRAYALRQLGALHLRTRARSKATASLREAHEIANALGARPLSDDIARLARAGGITRDVEAPSPTVPASPQPSPALTGREQQVLALVSDGLTNRQIAHRLFISERTAGTHISNLFAKLGVSSRFDAARAGRGLTVTHGKPVP